MKLYVFLSLLLSVSILSACSAETAVSENSVNTSEIPMPTEYIQQKEHLYLENSSTSKQDYTPINYSSPTGMWFPYMDYASYMQSKTAEEFRNAAAELYRQAKENGINTIYVHIHPCGDAYYNSDIFPKGTYLDGDYDPLEIMLEEAHRLNLSVHAWINPLRCQTTEQMEKLPQTYIVKQWTQTRTGSLVNIVGDRYYLNPAYEEVIDLVCRCADELVRNYNIDGFHIDDYFYPTTSPDFDRSAFETSGHSDLSVWRIENCSRLVHALYESVKRVDSRIQFGISPQGNIDANYSSQYADVKLWGSSTGYCDYIVPQIYYGFKNETCPFRQTLAQWENIVTNENITLIIGLAAYKTGAEDKWAGVAGELEWVENPDIIPQQIEAVKNSSAAGYALYY